MKILSIVFIPVLLLGCATTEKAVLSQKPVEVTKENIDEYWVQKNKNYSFSILSTRVPKKPEKGHVTVRFLIDSNGNIFAPEIIESVPEGAWDFAGVKAVSKQDFVPAKSNSLKVPVYYTQTIFFK